MDHSQVGVGVGHRFQSTNHQPSATQSGSSKKILDKVPSTQRQISVKKWHKILGELCSMSLALPGLRNISSTMQNAFSSTTKGRLALNKGVHHSLDDFCWMHDNISTCLTCIPKLLQQRVTTTRLVLAQQEYGSPAHLLPLDKGMWQPLLLYGDMNSPTAFPLN